MNNASATGCSSASTAASSRSRNPSSSPGRNGQLSSKFLRYYPPRYTSIAELYLVCVRTRTNPYVHLSITYSQLFKYSFPHFFQKQNLFCGSCKMLQYSRCCYNMLHVYMYIQTVGMNLNFRCQIIFK